MRDRSGLLEGVEDLVGYVEVGGDELNVVVVLEQVEQMEHLARAGRVRHLDGRRWQPLRLGRIDRDPGSCERGLQHVEVGWLADERPLGPVVAQVLARRRRGRPS